MYRNVMALAALMHLGAAWVAVPIIYWVLDMLVGGDFLLYLAFASLVAATISSAVLFVTLGFLSIVLTFGAEEVKNEQ